VKPREQPVHRLGLPDRPWRAREPGRSRPVAQTARQSAVEHRRHVGDNRIEIEYPRLKHLLAAEGQERLDQRGRTVRSPVLGPRCRRRVLDRRLVHLESDPGGR